jgi:3-oxoacyl-[acyl-carrier protein] reductase
MTSTGTTPQPPLAGKVALVTGASGAIGGAVCRALARAGAAVVLAARDEDALEQLADGIRDGGGSAVAITADVTDPDALERLRAGAERQLGPVDLLAAVAGGGGEPVALADLSLQRWHQTLDLNLTSVFLTLRAFLPGMAARGGGAVVTVASLAGQHVVPQAPVAASPAYAAAKAGLLMLTRQAAREFARVGVRVNAVSPGSVINVRIAGMPQQARQGLVAAQPLGRLGEPDDVAEAVLYLLGDASSWITGATLDVNGGFAML